MSARQNGNDMLDDKVVVVTGGAGLLGETICHAVAENNGTVVVTDIDKDRADRVMSSILKRENLLSAVIWILLIKIRWGG